MYYLEKALLFLVTLRFKQVNLPKAEKSIKIKREIGGKYGLQLSERKSQCIIFNMKENLEKCEKISIIEEVEEIKYLGGIAQLKKCV